MFPQAIDMQRVLPELIWCGFGVLVMLLQPFVRSRKFFTFVALLGSLGGSGTAYFALAHGGPGFFGLVQSDAFSFFFRLLVGTVSFLVVLAAGPYLDREKLPIAEFYALLFFATAGMGVLASAQELLTGFIGLEMSSISSYVLALVYGATGTTLLGKMAEADAAATGTLLKLGLAMILIGLSFKVAAAPFQVWTPDVYEGAPTPVTALFSAGPKSAAFALLLRIFATVPAATQYWFWAFWVLAALTMFAGNLGALVQTNIKRLLAYSSIAHAGYILVAFAAVTSMAQGGSAEAAPAYAAVLFYLLSYALVKLGAFTIVSQLGGAGEKNLSLDDYAGLSQRQPFVAAMLSVYLLSLLGLPVTAGFFGKFYIFKAAVNSHLISLAVLMAINSVIGAYYYLRVIVVMYMREPSAEAAAVGPVPFPIGVNAVLLITFVGTILFGLYPNPVINFILRPTLLGH